MGTTLATKQDLEIVRLAMKQGIDGLRAETQRAFELLRRDLSALDHKLTIKFGIMLFLGLGLVVAVLSP